MAEEGVKPNGRQARFCCCQTLCRQKCAGSKMSLRFKDTKQLLGMLCRLILSGSHLSPDQHTTAPLQPEKHTTRLQSALPRI